jgi:hypothetical protein
MLEKMAKRKKNDNDKTVARNLYRLHDVSRSSAFSNRLALTHFA